MIAFNMDGDRVNDEMARNHYRDKTVVELSTAYVCVVASIGSHGDEIDDALCTRFGAITCRHHRACEIEARTRYLESGEASAPQHLFLKPDGTLFRRKLWFMGRKEFATLLRDTHRAMFPKRLLPGETAPEAPTTPEGEAGKGEEEPVEPTESGAAPKEPETGDEIEAFVRESSDVYEIRKQARKLWVSKDKDDNERFEVLLADEGLDEKRRAGLLLALGFDGNKKAVKTLARFLEHDNELLRNHAAVALEDVGDGSALRFINRRLTKERVANVRKNLVRALGRSGRRKRTTADKLVKLSRSEGGVVGRNALIALADYPKSRTAEKALIVIVFRSGGGGGGRGGRGGRGGNRFGGLQNNMAGGYALAQMHSKEAKKEAEKRLETTRFDAVAEFYKAMIESIDKKASRYDPEVIKQRRQLAADEIYRDRDPLPKKEDEEKKEGEDEKDGEDNEEKDEEDGSGD